MSITKSKNGFADYPAFQERVCTNPCEPPESHHYLYYHNGLKHLPVVVAQFDERCVTYQTSCWCGGHTIHVYEVDRREAYIVVYI